MAGLLPVRTQKDLLKYEHAGLSNWLQKFITGTNLSLSLENESYKLPRGFAIELQTSVTPAMMGYDRYVNRVAFDYAFSAIRNLGNIQLSTSMLFQVPRRPAELIMAFFMNILMELKTRNHPEADTERTVNTFLAHFVQLMRRILESGPWESKKEDLQKELLSLETRLMNDPTRLAQDSTEGGTSASVIVPQEISQDDQQEPASNFTHLQLSPDGDEYLPREIDEEGEKKISTSGHLLGGREYLINTYRLRTRGAKLFMLAIECASILRYRDSSLLFNENPSLYQVSCTEDELIDMEIPNSYQSNQISMVTARSMFRQFGRLIVVDGQKVRDDYWEAKVREHISTEYDATISNQADKTRLEINDIDNVSAQVPPPQNLPLQVGDVVELGRVGPDIETHEGKKTTLGNLVENCDNGVVIFTYPEALTRACMYILHKSIWL